MSLYQLGCAVAGWAQAQGGEAARPEAPSDAETDRMISLVEAL